MIFVMLCFYGILSRTLRALFLLVLLTDPDLSMVSSQFNEWTASEQPVGSQWAASLKSVLISFDHDLNQGS